MSKQFSLFGELPEPKLFCNGKHFWTKTNTRSYEHRVDNLLIISFTMFHLIITRYFFWAFKLVMEIHVWLKITKFNLILPLLYRCVNVCVCFVYGLFNKLWTEDAAKKTVTSRSFYPFNWMDCIHHLWLPSWSYDWQVEGNKEILIFFPFLSFHQIKRRITEFWSYEWHWLQCMIVFI